MLAVVQPHGGKPEGGGDGSGSTTPGLSSRPPPDISDRVGLSRGPVPLDMTEPPLDKKERLLGGSPLPIGPMDAAEAGPIAALPMREEITA